MRKSLACLAAGLALGGAAAADPVSVLFVGNSYTFGRVNPVMSYNAANLHDLTYAMWLLANSSGSNAFVPHPWGGVPGIFKQFTVEAGLDYDLSLSTRNAASLRGHFLDTNGAGWDLRSNIALRKWNKVVLQEQNDDSLPRQPEPASNPEYFRAYTALIEDFFVHDGSARTFRDRDFFSGGTTAAQTAQCTTLTGASATGCNTLRSTPANPNANAVAKVYLYETWARPTLSSTRRSSLSPTRPPARSASPPRRRRRFIRRWKP